MLPQHTTTSTTDPPATTAKTTASSFIGATTKTTTSTADLLYCHSHKQRLTTTSPFIGTTVPRQLPKSTSIGGSTKSTASTTYPHWPTPAKQNYHKYFHWYGHKNYHKVAFTSLVRTMGVQDSRKTKLPQVLSLIRPQKLPQSCSH